VRRRASISWATSRRGIQTTLAPRSSVARKVGCDRNTALIAAAVLFGSVLGAFAGGYWWGSSAAQAAIHETETGLQAAFNNGPKAAQDWLNLMTWNDVVYSLSLCRGNGISIQHGRTACMVPLWIEKPVPAPPPQLGQ